MLRENHYSVTDIEIDVFTDCGDVTLIGHKLLTPGPGEGKALEIVTYRLTDDDDLSFSEKELRPWCVCIVTGGHRKPRTIVQVEWYGGHDLPSPLV